MTDPYELRGSIFVPPIPAAHRDDEYDSRGFDVLARMQRDHFWYRGRHRFLLHAVRRHLASMMPRCSSLRAIDLGGGCGGWVNYLRRYCDPPLAELALADSSEVALQYAARDLHGRTSLYQIDLLNLQWRDRWDLAFMLDVLEHIPNHEAALRQVFHALSPGGLLFVTVPALTAFWTWNDEMAHHQRRYSRKDFRRLADDCGLLLRQASYFMFFLSPLLMASRLLAGDGRGMNEEQRRLRMRAMHEVPHPIINHALSTIFCSETPLGHLVPFPWGTSLLGVFQKPLGKPAGRGLHNSSS